MSAFDPLAAIQADAALGQSAVAAIDLGVQIEILQSQISIGDLIAATVLPPQGGADRLSFLGQTVLAQLPPGVDPGESLLLQVSGFTGNQILVRNIGVIDPANPPPTVTVSLPQPEEGAPAQATLVTINNPSGAPLPPQIATPPQSVATNASDASVTLSLSPRQSSGQAPGGTQQSPAASAPVAPPRAVFVAASVRPAVPAPDAPAPRAIPTPPIAEELGVEARIAATRAASIDLSDLVNQPAPQKAAPTLQQPAAADQLRAAQVPPRAQPVVPPQIAPAGTSAAAASSERSDAIAPELALLARLRIPLLAFTIGAARIATNAASTLPRVFARLDAALAAVADGDARASAVRTIAAFLEKIDLGNARALPEQLMAYVSNVVDGAESKLAAILRALPPESEAEPLPPQAQSAPAPPTSSDASVTLSLSLRQSSGQAPGASSQQADAPVAQSAAQSANVAHAVERAVALQYDLKAAIASMIDTPPRGAPTQLAAALGDAMTTLTGVQLNVLNNQNADPNTIVIPLPVFYHDGGRPAQIRISRDAPNSKDKLDADNFHIAFVLDTKSLGTVAVDVQTASRSVSVNVKTEGSTAAERFKDTFGDLRGRLEQLHYRVANIAASVAPHARPDVVTAGKASEANDADAQPQSTLDLRA
jgi:hypothetical protein